MVKNSYLDGTAPRPMLTVQEVAYMLHVHPNTIRLWSKTGSLKAYRLGKRRDYRFDLADVKTFLYKSGSGQA
ncbi:MAG: hypothetical protein A2Y92_05900 [Chloroflexi bacterium RBG_13_57_8]|nr:MAG: hypothetical protein A2Y92_05900 [Chloroflexi bacterium RBG_13_57_8]